MKPTAPKTLRVVLLLASLICAQPARGLHPAGANSPLIIQSSSQISQQAVTGQDAATILTLSQAIEREISGTQKQSYQINLASGQFASLAVEQNGIDVVVKLFGPDDKMIAQVDGESRLHGQEIVETVARTSGPYRIEITPRYKFTPPGQYQIRLSELRAATDRDNALDEARRLFTQARGEYQVGNYAKAIETEQRCLRIRQEFLPPEHPDTGSALFNLGLYYRNAGDLPAAEDAYLRALEIREKALGPAHPDVALVLHNLGYFYYDIHDYPQSQSMYERALAIKENALGPEHPLVASTLGNMGLLQWKKKDYARAAAYYQRALEIFRKNDGPDSDDVAAFTHDLGIVYKESGDYPKGEAFYRQALSIWEKLLGKDHPRVAIALESLGILYRDKGDYQNAEPLLQRALNIELSKEGANHPDVANTLVILARLYEAKGDTARAIEYQTRAAGIEETNIERNLSLGSERQKLAYFSSISNEANRRISLHVRSAPQDPKARDLALTMVLQRKGRVLDALADTAAALRRSLSDQDQTLLDHLNDVTARLAGLVLEGAAGNSMAEHEKQVEALEAEREKCEEELSRHSGGLYQASHPVTIDDIQRALPENGALVEYAVYHPSDPKIPIEKDTPAEPRYVAYIIRKRAEAQWRDLGPAADIETAIERFRQALSDPLRADVQQRGRAVDEKVLQPVRASLGDATQLFISPDGALNLIPFAALVDQQEHYLLERYSLVYLTSGRDLLRMQVRRESRQAPVVVADPAFGAPAMIVSSNKNDVAGRAVPRVDYSQVFFGPLPGVTEEVRALRDMLPRADFLTRELATKAALRKLNAPSILHIATHGFFLEDEQTATAGNHAAAQLGPTKAGTRLTKLVAHADNPLLRSGLALAGANQSGGGNEDGILTALEMSGLDLWGTKLVVLSACDMGVGEVKNGDGVYGMRRALVLAGAESQVMSLWAVSDRSTRDLVVDYYRALLQGAGRGEALRQVQLQMLHNKAFRHPYYWAGFVQTGEWANLEGKR